MTAAAPRERAILALQAVLAVLFLYSMLLVFAGSLAGSLFSLLGFGPPAQIDTGEVQDYLLLPFMVLGAVLAGWTVMMIQVVRGPLRNGCEWALPLMTRSLAFWFVLDTAMSLVLGFPWHALFNIPIAIALAVPLLMLKRADRQEVR